MYFDFTKLPGVARYHLTTQTIIPRPVAWVLTESGENNYNLAPFSYFSPVASTPPLLMVSLANKPSGEQKDTLLNAQRTKKMVIHIPSESMASQVTESAKELAHGDSEISMLGMELVDFDGFSLPRLKACDIAFACSLYEVKEIGGNSQTIIFAEIEQLYASDHLTEVDGKRVKFDAEKINPLARLGGNEYASFSKVFTVDRPK